MFVKTGQFTWELQNMSEKTTNDMAPKKKCYCAYKESSKLPYCKVCKDYDTCRPKEGNTS